MTARPLQVYVVTSVICPGYTVPKVIICGGRD
jgi:hypothetical protein